MGFSLSGMLDPIGAFSGDKGDIVNNLLDPVGGFLQQNPELDFFGANELHNDVGDWMDDLGDANSAMAQNRWKNFRKGDGFKRMAMSGDLYAAGSPWGTKLNNEIYGRDDKPIWTTMGGKTSDDYAYAESKGEDTSANRGVDSLGTTIGNGFLNAFTFGLGSTAVNALDAWGYGDNAAAEDSLKKGAKNYAINYLGNEAAQGLGNSIPETGGYSEAGGGYVANSDYGGTGGFNLGKAVGAGDYAPVVNDVARGAASGAVGAAAQGGNSSAIGRGAVRGGTMSGVKTGGNMAIDYLGSMYNDEPMPDVGTLGGTMADQYGENSATLGGEQTPEQRRATLSMPTETSSAYNSGATSNPVQQFISSFLGGGSGGQGGGAGNYGDLAAGLFGMYNANKQRKRLKEQSDSLSNLFSPNSPYAQQMRQRLERRDAAAGRRSQYGPREAQLAAALADRQAQTMPQQERYAQGIGGYENAMANIGLRGAGSLYNMYNRPQAPAMGGSTRGYDPYVNRMYFGGGEGE